MAAWRKHVDFGCVKGKTDIYYTSKGTFKNWKVCRKIDTKSLRVEEIRKGKRKLSNGQKG